MGTGLEIGVLALAGTAAASTVYGIHQSRKAAKKQEKEISRLEIKILRIKRKYDIELKRDIEIKKRNKSIERFKNSVRTLNVELNTKLKDINKLNKLWCRLAKGEITKEEYLDLRFEKLPFFFKMNNYFI